MALLALIAVNGLSESLLFLAAIALHEAAHIIIGRFMGIAMGLPRAGLFGLRFVISSMNLSGAKALCLYLSGIFANLALGGILLVFSESAQMRFFAFYNFLIAAVNLIPAYPLDAARAICGLLAPSMGQLGAVKAMAAVSEIIASVMFVFGVYLYLFHSDYIIPMVMGCMIFFCTQRETSKAEEGYLKENWRRYA